MSVKKEPSGRRSVEVEVLVSGTPEEVWEAIATSAGVSSWFVPSELGTRVGGSIVCHMGPGMDSLAEITGWEPPHRLTAESLDWGPGAPPVATEWIVEARSGDTCVVRVVHSLFASSDDWDGQLEGAESGWPAFFEVLRLYLEHFRGQPCTIVRVMGSSDTTQSELWQELSTTIGLSPGEETSTQDGLPSLAGRVEEVAGPDSLRAALLLTEPAPGVGCVNIFSMAGRSFVTVGLYLYGDAAGAVAAQEEPRWTAWMEQNYPMPG